MRTTGMLKGAKKDSFEVILSALEKGCADIKALKPKSSIGTQSLLADIADKSEKLIYKIKQRIK